MGAKRKTMQGLIQPVDQAYIQSTINPYQPVSAKQPGIFQLLRLRNEDAGAREEMLAGLARGGARSRTHEEWDLGARNGNDTPIHSEPKTMPHIGCH